MRGDSEPAGDRPREAEQRARDKVVATVEAYPDLKGQELVSELMETLTNVENEIALMRAGSNDSVERYNTRTQRFPEVCIAKGLGSERASHFHAL